MPDAASPMRVFEFVQDNVAPPTLLDNGILIASDVQKLAFATRATTGSGLIVMVNCIKGPTHRFRVAVTDIVATIGTPVVFTGAV